MVQCCFTSTETVRLIRTKSPGRPPRLSHSSRALPLAHWRAQSLNTLPCGDHAQSSGAESRWPSWAFRPNDSYGFCRRKATLNHASALAAVCPWYVNRHPRTWSSTSASSTDHAQTHMHGFGKQMLSPCTTVSPKNKHTKTTKKTNFASENFIRNEDAAERLEKSVCMLQPAWLESEILSNHDAVRF